jgi:hypothetical protein
MDTREAIIESLVADVQQLTVSPEALDAWLQEQGWTPKPTATPGTLAWNSPKDSAVSAAVSIAVDRDDPFYTRELAQIIALAGRAGGGGFIGAYYDLAQSAEEAA